MIARKIRDAVDSNPEKGREQPGRQHRDILITGSPQFHMAAQAPPATYLVVGLSEITLAQHQRSCIPYLFAAPLMMTAAAVVFRVVPF